MKRHLVQIAKPAIEHFPKLAMRYRHVRDSWRLPEEPVETPLGFKLAGNASMQDGSFEPEETKLATQILQQVDTFINVGANVGYYCCLALSLGKNTVAFEPIDRNLRYLLRNIKANGWEDRVEVYPLALGNSAGIAEIYGSSTGASLVKGWANIPESYVTLVPVSTLDTVLGARFQGSSCFVLIDIEGAEKAMLEGAASFLGADPKPVWMVEISVGEHQPQGVSVNPHLLSTFQIFWDRGYESWTGDARCRVVQLAEVEAIASGGLDTLHARNFLFLEKGTRPESILAPDSASALLDRAAG